MEVGNSKQAFGLFICILLTFLVSLQATGRYEFNEADLGNDWIWDDPDGVSAYSLEETPGHLSITCDPETHHVWQTRSTAPMMLTKAPAGNYEVETYFKMRKFPICGYAGIQVIGSGGLGDPEFSGPWAHLVIEKQATQPQTTCRVRWSLSQGEAPANAFEIPVDLGQDEAYMRLVKADTNWDCYFKAEVAAEWQLVGTGQLDPGEEYYIGFVVGKYDRWGGFGKVIADFDYFRSPIFPVEPRLSYITTFGKIKTSH